MEVGDFSGERLKESISTAEVRRREPVCFPVLSTSGIVCDPACTLRRRAGLGGAGDREGAPWMVSVRAKPRGESSQSSLPSSKPSFRE